MEKQLTLTENEVKVIRQGKPKSPYFHIIEPMPGKDLVPGMPVSCQNPKTRETVKGVVTEHIWTIDWKDVPKGWILSIWGVEPGLLRTVLIQNDPLFENPLARIILIRETK